MAANTRLSKAHGAPDLDRRKEVLDQDLTIMEAHATEMDETEIFVQEAMRKWDREHKDAHLHSTTRSRKHTR